MSIQVLVATMNQTDNTLLDRMNIQSDAIVANQCEKNIIDEFKYKGSNIKFISFAERGVGLNRNNALMRADADICVLADDDVVFINGYSKSIEDCFNENPNADVILFNLIENPRRRFVIEKKITIGYHNFMKFGAPRIAFRRKSITRCGISFNLHFGGGSEFSAGEDTLFLRDCLRNNLKIIAVPVFIAELTDSRGSTWFQGYNDKYFIDRGALFAALSSKWARILCLQFVLRHKKKFIENKSWIEAFQLMQKGIGIIKNKKSNEYF